MTTFLGYRFVRRLEYFEGPLLVQVEDETGEVFVVKFCTRTWSVQEGHVYNTYLVTRATPEYIERYLDGKLSYLELLTIPNDNKGLLVTETEACGLTRKEVMVTEIDEKFLPKVGVFHDPDLRQVMHL